VTRRSLLIVGVWCLAALPALAQPQSQSQPQPCAGPPAPGFLSYVPRIEPRRVLVAWGDTSGENTIGRSSMPHGAADVWVDGVRTARVTDRNWTWLEGLAPDRAYTYVVCLDGRQVQTPARVQTYPETSRRLRFFVIGDFGTGESEQRAVAARMLATYRQTDSSDNPVRFVLTTGDNIYRSGFMAQGTQSNSGRSDTHWAKKFYEPYADLIRSIPFLPSVGNHDRGETEREEDLAVLYDNFFYEPLTPYYTFVFGQLAQFFSLNTTSRTDLDIDKAVELGEMSEQRRWLQDELAKSRAPWRIPFFHHPPFEAGPEHADEESRGRGDALRSLFPGAVRVAFTGHEHNFQFSEQSAATGNVRYVVTGAGGRLNRDQFTVPLAAARIERVARERHFLRVDLDEEVMTIEVISDRGEVLPLDRQGRASRLPPITVK
jgi:hypothetical protein